MAFQIPCWQRCPKAAWQHPGGHIAMPNGNTIKNIKVLAAYKAWFENR